MIILSAGMQKAGSGWYFNLTNDLLVATGYDDVRSIRGRFRLQEVLKDYNCNVEKFTLRKLSRLLVPHILGHTFAIKTHYGPPVKLLQFCCVMRLIKATYIFRDPRDVVVSAFEHGEKIRNSGETHTFATLSSIENAIEFVQRLLKIWDEWQTMREHLNGFVIVEKYENMVSDSMRVVRKLARFLNITVDQELVRKIMEKYSQDSITTNPKGLHFNKGTVGRFRNVLNKEQLDLCERYFGPYLQRMGYSS